MGLVRISAKQRRRQRCVALASDAAAWAVGGSLLERLESRQLMSVTPSVAVGNSLYTINGSDLYRSDLDGSNSSVLHHWKMGAPSQLFAGPDKLFFVAPADAINGVPSDEPWVSDGTTGGTKLLNDIYEGASSSYPHDYHLVNGHVVFLADDDTRGNTQLYTTDGTWDGTVLLSPFLKHGYVTAVKNVTFDSTSVSFDYTSDWTDQTDHLISDGGTGLYAGYSTPTNGRLQLGGSNNLQITTSSGGDLVVTGLWTTFHYHASGVYTIVLSDTTGNDTISVDPSISLPVTITSSGGSDTLSGGSGGNTLILLNRESTDPSNRAFYNAAVTLTSGGGAFSFNNGDQSILHGAFTNVQTGSGNDTIIGTSANETLSGGQGNDSLIGGGGNDSLDGGAGNDWISVSGGPLANNTDGASYMYGRNGSDTLIGGNGNDHLDGGTGDDSITGNDGDDVMAADGGSDTLIGGAGNNTTVYAPIPLSGDGGGTTTSQSNSTLPSYITIKNGMLTINGGSGGDIITLIDHPAAKKLFVTWDGDTTAIPFSHFTSIVVNGNGGDDTLDATQAGMAVRIYGGAGHDLIDGSAFNDRIYGGDDADFIYGNGGNDILYGEAGNDRLFGGAGIDHLDAGGGTNLLRGGDGRDTLAVGKTDDLHANIGDLILHQA